MSNLHGFFLRLRRAFRRREHDRDLAAEMNDHLEQETARRIAAGEDPATARRRAAADFGSVDARTEEVREARLGAFPEQCAHDLGFALRQLRKSPGFAATALGILALGIGACTAMFSLTDGVLLKPLPYAESDRLVAVLENHRERQIDNVELNAPGFLDWRAQNTVFEDMAAYQGRGFDLTGHGQARRIFGVRASASLFSLLRVSPALGRGFTAEEDREGHGQVTVLSHRMWQEVFGESTEVLGRTVTLDGDTFTVIGVLPADFRLGGFDADLWVPMAFQDWEVANRGGHSFQGLARLKPGVSLTAARTELNAIAARLSAEYPKARGWGITLLPLRDRVVGDSGRPLLILFGAVMCVLAIACANLANLLLARAVAREREFALRSALGASRRRLTRQLLLESLMLCGVGGLLGILLASGFVHGFVALYPDAFPRLADVGVDARALVFTVAIALGTGLIFGIAPAMLASRVSLQVVLQDGGRGSTSARRHGFRTGFIVLQIALTFVLLTGASLLLRSFARVQAIDLGFDPGQKLTATLSMSDTRFPGGDTERGAFVSRLVDHLAEQPGVESAAAVMGLPLSFLAPKSALHIDGRPVPAANVRQSAGYSQITPGYFRTIGATLLRGRPFDERDSAMAPFVVIVNESFVRAFFGDQDPLGQRLFVMDSRREQPTEIIGIVHDLRQRSITGPAEPEMYFPIAQRCWADAQLVLRAYGDPTALTGTLRDAVAEVAPDQTLFAVRTFESLTADALKQQRLQLTLLGAFAGAGLLLSIVGIYAVVAFEVNSRTHEIGVRTALGAQPRDVRNLVVGRGGRLAVAGIMLGGLSALVLSGALRNQLYDITPTDPLSFVLVAAMLGLATILASWLPARRAAKVDPIQALRAE